MSDCRYVPPQGRAPATLYLCEHETCQTDALSPLQAQALHTRFRRYLDIRPAWLRENAWDLSAKQYVGTIVLDDLRIIVEPKVDMRNLFYMLTFAYDLPNFRSELATAELGEDIFEFVVVIFLRQVKQLIQRGIYRTYVSLDENERYLRGRLMLAEHLQQNSVRVDRFSQRRSEFTADVMENRILKYTLLLLSRIDYRDPSLRLQLRRAGAALAETQFVSIKPSDCDQIVYTRLNAAYRSPINLAKLLIQNLSVEGNSGAIPFAAYLLDMNRVFELFIARYLDQHFAIDPVIQVDIQQDIWLDDAQKEIGKPDIVLRSQGRPFLILDTKYKSFHGQPDPADRNQMIVYCTTMALPRGILVYPDEQPVAYRSIFRGVTLSARSLSLAGSLPEFAQRCQHFATDLAQVIGE